MLRDRERANKTELLVLGLKGVSLDEVGHELPFHLTALAEALQRSLLTGNKQATDKLLLKLKEKQNNSGL